MFDLERIIIFIIFRLKILKILNNFMVFFFGSKYLNIVFVFRKGEIFIFIFFKKFR